MARGYVALPAYNPGPQQIDFSQLNSGIDALGKSMEKNRLLQQQKDIGTALSQGGYGEAADKAFSLGDLKTGLALTQAEEGQEDRDFNRNRLLAQDRRSAASDARSRELHSLKMQEARSGLRDKLVSRVAGIAQMIRNEQDPMRKAQMLSSFVNSDPRIKQELNNVGYDPENPDAALDLIISEARGLAPTTKPQFTGTKYGVLNKYTGELQPYDPSVMLPEDRSEQAKLEQSLRKEYSQLNKDYREVRDGLQRVRAGAQLNTGAGDVATVFGYMKTLDPNSTVREGEFATAEQTSGLPGQVVSVYNRIVSGERLTPEQRENFVKAAEALAKDKFQEQQRIEAQFGRISKAAGADPTRVITNFAPPENNGNDGIDPRAIKMLRQDPSPERQSQFDEIFGPGAAQRALGR